MPPRKPKKPPAIKKTPAPARKKKTSASKTRAPARPTPSADNLVPEYDHAYKTTSEIAASVFGFDPAMVRQSASNGMLKERIAEIMLLDLAALDADQRTAFDTAFTQGAAIGLESVLRGVKMAAVTGDTKAAELYMAFTAAQRHSADGATSGGAMVRRLRVEVTTDD